MDLVGIGDFAARLDRIVVMEAGLGSDFADHGHFMDRGHVPGLDAGISQTLDNLGRRIGLDREGDFAGEALEKDLGALLQLRGTETKQGGIGLQGQGRRSGGFKGHICGGVKHVRALCKKGVFRRFVLYSCDGHHIAKAGDLIE